MRVRDGRKLCAALAAALKLRRQGPIGFVLVVLPMTALRSEHWSKTPRGVWERGLGLLVVTVTMLAFAAPALAEGVQVGIGPVGVNVPAPPVATDGSTPAAW